MKDWEVKRNKVKNHEGKAELIQTIYLASFTWFIIYERFSRCSYRGGGEEGERATRGEEINEGKDE